MAKITRTTGRGSGTGQDTPTVCVHVPPRFPLRQAGHSGTLSRPVPHVPQRGAATPVPHGRVPLGGFHGAGAAPLRVA
jgi:hypothetical protein